MGKIMKLATALLATALSTGTFAQDCTTIQDGTLLASDGSTITTGFDDWGYNYQAHLFSGGYCDSYRDAEWCQPWADIDLMMKWNEAWLSNQDCNGDGLLDRHYGYADYIGSGAWLTNHQSGRYVDDNGKKQRWTYFSKIVAGPADGWVADGQWMMLDAQGNEVVIGPVIWGAFATIMEVYTDTGDPDSHGLLYKSPNNAGLGSLTPE